MAAGVAQRAVKRTCVARFTEQNLVTNIKEADLLYSPHSCDPFLSPFDLIRLARKPVQLYPGLAFVVVTALYAAVSPVPLAFFFSPPTLADEAHAIAPSQDV